MANIPPLPPRPNNGNEPVNPFLNNTSRKPEANPQPQQPYGVPPFNRPQTGGISQQQTPPATPQYQQQSGYPQQPQNGYNPNPQQQFGYAPQTQQNQGSSNAPKSPKKKNLVLWISLGVAALLVVVAAVAFLPASLLGFQPDSDKYPTDTQETTAPSTDQPEEPVEDLPDEYRFVINKHTTTTGETLEVYAPSFYEEWEVYSEPVTEVENDIPSSFSVNLVKVNDETCRVQSNIFENPDDIPVSDFLIKATGASFSSDEPTEFKPYSENLNASAYLYPTAELSGNTGVATIAWFSEFPDVYAVTIIYCEEPSSLERLRTEIPDVASDFAISYRGI